MSNYTGTRSAGGACHQLPIQPTDATFCGTSRALFNSAFAALIASIAGTAGTHNVPCWASKIQPNLPRSVAWLVVGATTIGFAVLGAYHKVQHA